MVKVLAVLPPRKYFQPIEPTEAWEYIWQSTETSRLRIYSRHPNPWDGLQCITVRESSAKTDKVKQTNRVDLRCVHDRPDSYIPAYISLEFQFGGIPHSNRETLRFYAIPSDKPKRVLMLSVWKP